MDNNSLGRNEGIKNPRYKHGGVGTRLYNIWKGIKKRCYNKNSSRYRWYGAKGVTMCEEWLSFEAFKTWANNNGYADNLTIERNRNELGYSPENCIWVTQQEQIKNQTHHVEITINGQTMILSDWCKKIGLTYRKVYGRAKNRNISTQDYIFHFLNLKESA